MKSSTPKGTKLEVYTRDTSQVLILEDLEVTAQWLAAVTSKAFPEARISIVGTLAEARKVTAEVPPDIALIDLELPDGSGVELIRELAQKHPQCQCIVTSIYSDDRHLFPALRAGAAGYLLKDQPEDRVITALRAINAGEPPLSPTIAQRMLRVFGENEQDSIGVQLTTRETETLVLIAKGLRLPEVAQQLNVTRNTAAGYVKIIYRKLNVSSRAEAALEAVRMGLVNRDA